MNSREDQDIDKLLERFRNEWPADGSIVERVMETIESTKVHTTPKKQRSMIVKSLLAIAASLAIFGSLWLGFAGNGNSLYAQVMSGIRNARTLHTAQRVQPKDGTEPRKVTQSWYERGVGFRTEGPRYIRIGNKESLWNFDKERNVATRSQTNGIKKALEPLFMEVDHFARQLQDEFERYPQGDATIEGRACQAYRLAKFDRYVEPKFKSGKLRILAFLDEKSRLVRRAIQSLDGDVYRTISFMDLTYDEPIDGALFEPDFGDDVQVVDADAAFDKFVDPASAIYNDDRDGILYAIHRVQRFENGGVLVVSSIRGTEETLKEFPLTSRQVRPGLYFIDGPAVNLDGSPQGDGFFRLGLASANHQGINVCWWVLTPQGTPPNHFEVSPGRIRLPVGISPRGEYAKARHADSRGTIHPMTWDIELDVPRTTELPTLEDITNQIYADQIMLEAVPIKELDVGYYGKTKTSIVEVNDISRTEYAKAVANKIRSWMQNDIEFQLERQFSAKSQKHAKKWGATPVIYLSYERLVDDATLERVAKRTSLRRLYLRGDRITDDGLRHLSGLTKLEELDLADTDITDKGLRYLSGLSDLKMLDISGTKVTADGVAMIEKAIPNVKVKWRVQESDPVGR